jgi:multidrug efflux pump subunit AcrB
MLSKTSVKKPLTVVAIIIIILVLGYVSFSNTTIDLLPELDLPYVVVATIYAGAPPEAIEKEITTPLEQSISQVSGIKSLTSYSRENVSIILCEIAYKKDVGDVMANIKNTVELVSLPEDDLRYDPMIVQYSINNAPIMYLSIGREGQTLKDNTEYFNNVINKLNGVDGVAKVSADGLVSNLALVNLDSSTTSHSLVNFFTTLAGTDLKVPDSVKEELHRDLQELLADAESNPELITNGKLDPDKVLDNLVIPYLKSKDFGGDDALLDSLFSSLIKELKKPNSAVRRTVVKALNTALEERYMLEDGEANKAVFNALVDKTFSEVVYYLITYYTGSLTSMLSSELLQKVIYAQDFEMPAGSIDIGAMSYVVKVGNSIKSRDELCNMPVVSLDLSNEIKDYVKYLQGILQLAAIASGNGTTDITSTNLKLLSESIANLFETVDDYGLWAAETIAAEIRDSYLDMDETVIKQWAELINADPGFAALAAGFSPVRPADWRTKVLQYIKDNKLYLPQGTLIAAETHWDTSYTAYYNNRLTEAADSALIPLKPTAEEYADYVITVASTSLINTVYALSETDKENWKTWMLNDTMFFMKTVNNLTTDKDWRKTILDCVVVHNVFPKNTWDATKITAYREVLNLRLEQMDMTRPSGNEAYANYVVNQVAVINPLQDYYLTPEVREIWIKKLSENTNFSDKCDSITRTDNWQRVILNYVRENSALLFPIGATLTTAKYWDVEAVPVYEQRIDTLIVLYQPVTAMSQMLENNLSADNLELLYSIFDGRSADEVYDTLVALLKLLQKYGGEGAVTIRYNPSDDVTTYSINFSVIYATLDSLKEVLTLQLALKDLGKIDFFCDATGQVTNVLQRINGTLVSSNSVMLRIEKEPDASTYDVIRNLKTELSSIKNNDSSFLYAITYDDSQPINFMLNAVKDNFLWGGLLAVIVLFLFLRNMKATIAISLSIVISVLTTFVLMYFSGVTLNVLSMGGLVIGVGMLVDNSVVVLENIVRLRTQGKDIYRAAIQGAKQVGGAILGSTITTVIIFLPVLFIEGMTTMFVKDMALTICYSLLASLLVALTLVPAFSSTMMKKNLKQNGKITGGLQKVYAKTLNFALHHKLVALLLVAALFAGSVVLAATSIKVTFFPDITTNTITIVCAVDNEAIDQKNIGIDPNSDDYYTHDMALQDASKLMIETFSHYDDIAEVGISMSQGLSLGGIQVTEGTNLQADIVLIDEKSRKFDRLTLRQKLIDDINQASNGIFTAEPGDSNLYEQFTSFAAESYTIRLYGNDIAIMREEAEALCEHLRQTENVLSVSSDADDSGQEYKLVIDKEKANYYGLTTAEVYLQISAELKKPGIAQSLRLTEETGLQQNVDVYIYDDSYINKVWYEANDSDGNLQKVYFRNNTESGAYYYIINSSDKNVVVMLPGSDAVTVVEAGGEIPVIREENSFTYLKAVTIPQDGGNLVQYTEVTYVSKDLNEYFSIKRTPIDLVMLPITSGDPLQTGNQSVQVPLYKLLKDESFATDENGNILYRSTLSNTEMIPSAIKLGKGYSSIIHEDGRKCITITISYDSKVKEKAFQKIINDSVAEYVLTSANKDSVYIVTTQKVTIMDEVYNTLITVLLIAIGLIYLVMVAQFQSFKHPLIIMSTIPLAFTGSFLLLFVTGTDLGILPIIGLLVLVGIVVNNGIVFVDYVNNLIRSGTPRREAILRTGIDRLRPILMTSLTTIVALSITALNTSQGNIILRPLALTTVGGMVYATFMTLFIVPILYDILNRKARQTKKDMIMMSKDVDKIDADDIGIDKLDPEMDYYVKSLAVSEKKNLIKIIANHFKKRYSSLINKNPMAANTDQTSKEAAAADSEEIKPPEEQSEDWIEKIKKNANKKE